MLNKVDRYIQQENLLSHNNTYLLALSGGIDSVVLFHLLLNLRISFQVAHVNFQLRGYHSNLDMNFCKELCQSHNIPIFIHQADTQKIAKNEKLSIQMAARKIRYDYFQELITQHAFSGLITAHHLNDQAENMFIYLLRNNIYAAFYGIPSLDTRGSYPKIRPLMCCNKNEILSFAIETNLYWREDLSNASNKYLRNNIRNNIIQDLIIQNSNFLEDTHQICKEFRSAFPFLHPLEMKTIDHSSHWKNDLFKFKWWLKSLGFHYKTIDQILQPHQTGASFSSSLGQLTKDRNGWKWIPKEYLTDNIILPIDISLNDIPLEFELFRKIISISIVDQFIESPSQWTIPLQNISFPITIRTRKNGDTFIPKGMSGKVKLSDFLINKKIENYAKDQMIIFEDRKSILAVDNLRGSIHTLTKNDPKLNTPLVRISLKAK